ncbi:anti-sigma factor family protein [Nocardiopsis oceani]
MDHLGERLSALIDGELGAAEHERALIHLAKCESCRFEADMTRRLKRRLTGLGEPEPDMDFMGRLMSQPGLGATRDRGDRGPSDPPPSSPFGSSPPLGSSRPLGGFPGGGPLSATETGPTPPREQQRTRTQGPVRPRTESPSVADRVSGLLPNFSGGRYAVAGLAVTTALLGSAFIAGGDAEDAPVVEPRLSDYAVDHAVSSRQIPVVDPPIDPLPVVDEGPSDTTETTR